MKKRIYVEASIKEQLLKFLNVEGIKIEVTANEHRDVTILQCEDRKESDLNTIYSGGWVACETARALAKKLAIPVRQIGKLLDHLDVKIRRCGLGCFK
ncbi:MAG: hypothetical protein KAS75_04015 [Planctomycetes bacterium]|nr:hypothetical protein [Planctomycetota bacterium]